MADTYCAKYGGIVRDNQDPDKLGRLKVWVPSLFLEDDAAWAVPALPYGVFFLPEVGATVWVEFEGGDADLPIWTGIRGAPGGWAAEADPPTRRVLKTLAGHLVVFDDGSGDEAVEVHDGKGASAMVMNKDGVTFTDGVNGNSITMTSTGVEVKHGQSAHVVTLDGAGITVSHGSSPNTVTIGSSGVKIEASPAASVELTPSGITITAASVTVGGGVRPVLLVGDTGVGNLGAPVPLIGPGSTILKAL